VFKENETEIPVTRPAGHIKVRVYTPEGQGPFPVHLNYHGGKKDYGLQYTLLMLS